MNAVISGVLSAVGVFLSQSRNRYLLCLLIIAFVAVGDFQHSGLARRTFMFYDVSDGHTIVENRMLRRGEDRETDIRRYVNEVLLGPRKHGGALLFERGTRLKTLLYREGSVYADLSEGALFPFEERQGVFHSLLVLNEGIRRNFTSVTDVRLSIGGQEVFFNEFGVIFNTSADNSETSP